MQRGWVMGLPTGSGWMTYAGNVPCTIGWLARPPRGRGPSDQLDLEPLVRVGVFTFSRHPRFPAERCEKCRTLVVRYDHPVFDPRFDLPTAAAPLPEEGALARSPATEPTTP